MLERKRETPADPKSPREQPRMTRVRVPSPFAVNVLAVGGELKNTVCAGTGDEAVISAPHGDLLDPSGFRRFLETTARFTEDFRGRDFVVAHDMHPAYMSSTHALEYSQRKVPVQHHHAHAVSCAIDAGLALPVIGVVCDGTGYGTDGSIWGGEVLLCNTDSFRRVAHLHPFALPGGDAAARWTWRPALSLMREAFPEDWRSLRTAVFESVDPAERKLVTRQLDVGLNTPKTSSLGRLFDGVAFLAGIRQGNDTEAQAAIALQAAADAGRGKPYSFELHDDSEGVLIDWRPMIRELVADVQAGANVSTVSTRFHETVAEMFAAVVVSTTSRTGIDRVVLSGGCFLNDLLRGALKERLEASGLRVGMHNHLSTGDAGLSLGQAVIASAVASCANEETRGD